MHPVLFVIPIFGGLPIHTYGVLVALGFLLGMWWVNHDAKRIGIDPAKATDLVFFIIIAAIIGSRLMYMLLTDRQRFFSDPLSLLRIWEGGLTFYGGVIASVAMAMWYTRRHRAPFWRYADLFAPGIALGHAVGRLGCLAVGCCHGRVADGPHWWTLTFPQNPQSFAPPAVPLYPTQLIEAVGELSIFLILLLMRRRIHLPGRLFTCYLFGYGLVRFFTEPMRSDQSRDFLFGHLWSMSQLVSVIAIVGAPVIWCTRRREPHV